MKKATKNITYFLLFILVIIIVIISTNNYFILKNIKKNDAFLKRCWSEYFILSSNRINLVESVFEESDDDSINQKMNIIEKNIKDRGQYKNECSLKFVKLEYEVDKIVYNFPQKRNVLELNFKLNQLVDKYNQSVLIYNKYISVFPNFLIAKQNGFRKKEFFTIKYGILDEDPLIKSKKIPSWAVGVDTTM